VKFQFLEERRIKMAVFWDVAPCILVDTYRRFRGAYCLNQQHGPDYTAHLRRQTSFEFFSFRVRLEATKPLCKRNTICGHKNDCSVRLRTRLYLLPSLRTHGALPQFKLRFTFRVFYIS